MRKITTLLMLLLLCSIGAKAQAPWASSSILSIEGTPVTEISDGFYIIENPGTGSPITYKSDCLHRTDIYQSFSVYGVNAMKDLTATLTNDYGLSTDRMNYVVKIEKNGDAYTIQFNNGSYMPSIYPSYYLYLSSTPNDVYINHTDATNSPTIFVIADSDADYSTTVNLKGQSSSNYDEDLQASAGATGVYTWRFFKVNLDYSDEVEESYTIKMFPGEGVFYRKGDINADNWCEKFESNGTPQVTVATSAGDRKINLKELTSGYFFSCGVNIQWNISVEDGYVITGYKIVGKGRSNDKCSVKPENGEKVYFNTATESTVDVSGLNTQSTYFITNDDEVEDRQIQYTTFEIYVKKVPATPVETKHTLTVNYSAWGSSEAPFTVKKEIAEGENVTASDIELEYYKDFDADVTFPFEMTSDKTVNVDCTPDFPFVSGNVYGLIDDYKKLYFEYNTSQSGTHITRYHGLTAPQFNRSTYWVFEHVPGTQNLFTLYNMQEKKYVTMSELPTTKVADANNATYAKYPTLTDAPTTWTEGLVPTSYFRITKQNDNCFHMEHPADPTLVASNAHNYSIILWWGDAAPANSKSGFQTKDIKASLTEALSLEAERQEITSDYITAQTLTRFTASAKALLTSVANGTEEPTKSNIAQIIDGFTSVSDTFDELVDEDAIYQIIFTRGDNVMGMYNAEADKDGVASTEKEIAKPMTALQDTEVDSKNITNTLWRFVKNGTRFNIQHVNGNLYLGAFMNDDETGSRAYISSTRNQAEAAGFEVEGDGSDVWAIKNPESTWQKSGSGAYRMYFNSTYQTTSGGNKNHYIGAYTSGLSDSGSTLKVKKISTLPLSVSAAGWTAFCFPVKVTVPDGVTVYQATSSNGESLHLEEVAAGTVLPAGAGFLCEAAEGTYNFGITAADAADFSSNLLTGATLRRTGMTANSFYALANKADGVGFYRVNSETVPANKPFLPASALTSSVREMLSFDFGMATGISNTQNADRTDTSVLYDLNGRRVYYPVRGIYVNGRGEKIFLNK